MAVRDPFDDPVIQDYVDDRLDETERAQIAARLARDPGSAAEVERMRGQNAMLRELGREVLEEPVPERLRATLRAAARPAPAANAAPPSRRRTSGFLEAAAAVLLFVVGGSIGWVVRGQLQDTQSVQDMILASAIGAYSFYGSGDYPVDFPPERSQEFAEWVTRTFEREVPTPDLADSGFVYAGGRLVPSAGVRIGVFQFSRGDDSRLGVFFWPMGENGHHFRDVSRSEDVVTRIRAGNGLTIAVVGGKPLEPELDDLADRIFASYE